MKLIPIEEIIPYDNNPRINDKAVDAVAESIDRFGFKVPIIIDGDNVIIAGHTRLKASEKLGLKQIPVIVANDLDEEQVRAYRLADNKTSELAEWDFEKLQDELSLIDMDMSAFDFDMKENIEDSPIDFKEFDDDIETKNECPKCGYEW